MYNIQKKENSKDNKSTIDFTKISKNKKEQLKNAQKFSEEVIDALNNNSTPYHCIEWARNKLLEAGFSELKENDLSWTLQPGNSYFLTRDLSSVIAFSIGYKVEWSKTAFVIVGGHTDSPTLRFAPNSYLKDNSYEKLNLQTYGGGQWQTWFDRDLSIAGKVVVKNPSTEKLETRLFKVDEPIMFVPNLCIHLRKDKENFYWNNEDHLKSIIGTDYFDDLYLEDEVDNNLIENIKNTTIDDKSSISSSSSDINSRRNNKINKVEDTYIEKKLGYKLATLLSKKLNITKDRILDYNIVLYDTHKAQLSGINKEFITSQHFDNQGTSIINTMSIIEASKEKFLSNIDTISISCLFDSEEIGSLTYQGANSTFFKDTLRRIYSSIDVKDSILNRQTNCSGLKSTIDLENAFQSCCSRSFLLSTDMAHLYHPNYPEYYQNNHKPLPNLGPVIKTNANGKYSTEAEGASLIKYIATMFEIPMQDFMVRQDLPCGTTIGPIIAGKSGIRSIDIGVPQLAMHSIREQTAVLDLQYLFCLFVFYYYQYSNSVGNLFNQTN